eukprot:CAMPEP_0185163050 /NCGR_PEP_ID=MMETSP1139-20130426/7456_1 /TAXON_ID=298111 /ORGANISM="Pavlova sp., Strain CCMP459" /LENGTH=271 /DNA_ID=CAMNT_0027728399 /DNA_START=76 /DNA_END=891 /DNA_ORIENTATION=+
MDAWRHNVSTCKDRRTPNASLGIPPLPPTELGCRLVVIAAGMARSGSTLQERLLEAALTWLRVRVHMKGYWELYRHNSRILLKSNPEQLQSMASSFAKRLNNLTSNAVVLFKSHEYDGRLVRLCRKHLVFTSHRHPIEVLISRASLWGLNKEPLVVLRRTLSRHACWKAVAVEDTSNEELRSHLVAVFDRYVSILGVALYGSAFVDSHSESASGIASKQVLVHGVRGNPSAMVRANKGRMRSFSWLNSSRFRQSVSCHFGTWLAGYNYTVH